MVYYNVNSICRWDYGTFSSFFFWLTTMHIEYVLNSIIVSWGTIHGLRWLNITYTAPKSSFLYINYVMIQSVIKMEITACTTNEN
jgi:hypothetical protein